jgi:proteasome assembly chaperone (PAC2) family protein
MDESLNHWQLTGELPDLVDGTLLLSFSGWMDGGQASTGTVSRFIEQLEARPFAEIDPEPFYIFNVPGSMDVSALFRPEIEIEDGLVRSIAMPENLFFTAAANNLLLFTGREPNLKWRTYGDSIIDVAKRTGIKRLMFVGSFGGAVPHTREPKMYVTCSEERLHDEMAPFGMRRTSYDGPGSFMTYLMTRAPDAGLEMVSLVAEIPGYLQGSNPFCIEAITRRLAAILKLPLDVDELRSASNEWEEHISSLVEDNDDMVERIRQLEDRYDRELLELEESDD